ncbi:hypothetical protein RJ640_016042 [Escallonia rubra]|uniref:GAG-pre-integrase domain-containing protein n=1 Tax=Escallonia rubra TaxID=112253 RepID=A0AA88QQF2_9ASTE|nr:hypothetical protein RJ640_016042 [Escallonia rubra]
MKFMLNEQELEEHLTKEMVAPTEAQPLRDHTAYQKWNQKDRSARYTLLSSLQNDLIGQYDELSTCKALWEQLKFTFGGTSTTRLRSLVIKFEEYTKDPKHTMSEHLRVMSNMIGKLRDAGHALTDEQQVRAVIRSLPASWANMKQILTHSENIKNFSDVSQHVILEAETRDANKTLTYVAKRDRTMQMASAEDKSSYSYVVNDNIMNDSTTWHARLGHIGQDRMTRLAREGFLGPLAKVNLQTCETCLAESDFPSIGDASKNLDLYELEEVEPTLPSPSEGGELVPHPVVAEDSRILRYLRGTADLVLCYHGGDLRLRGYSDADWGGDRDERKSTSGGAISWYSKKKSCIALSTMELEYVACSAAVQEAVWLRSFLQALGVIAHVDEAVAVHCENTAALDFVKDPKYHA